MVDPLSLGLGLGSWQYQQWLVEDMPKKEKKRKEKKKEEEEE